MLLGLLSILCKVPVGRAGSWKNSSYLHSRFGGDRRGELPKRAPLPARSALEANLAPEGPAGGGEGGLICRNWSEGDPQVGDSSSRCPQGCPGEKTNPPGVGSAHSAALANLIWVGFSSGGAKSGRGTLWWLEGREGVEQQFGFSAVKSGFLLGNQSSNLLWSNLAFLL